MEIISIISGILGAFLSAVTLATLINQGYSKRLKRQMQEAIVEYSSKSNLELKAKIDDLSGDNVLLKNAVMDMARERLHSQCQYYIKEGNIDAHSLFCLDQLYSSYEALGGNTFIKDEMEQIRHLPLQ